MAQVQDYKKTADKLYQKFGKPLESEHYGEYVTISTDGETVVDANLLGVMKKAKDMLGLGSFVFKLGERAVWKWR